MHIDEIVAATQNLLKNPEEREVSVAVSRLRFPEGKDAQLIMWLRQHQLSRETLGDILSHWLL